MKKFIGVTHKIFIRRRASIASFGAAFGLLLTIVGGATPAHAVTVTYDKFGQTYQSHDLDANIYNSSDFIKPGYSVQWTPGNKVIVGADLEDVEADSAGPILKINVIAYTAGGTRGGLLGTYYLHNPNGANTEVYKQVQIPWLTDQGSEGLDFYACNGFTSSGTAKECGAVHGTFRP